MSEMRSKIEADVAENIRDYMIVYPDGSSLSREDFLQRIAKPVADSIQFVTDELVVADARNAVLRRQRNILVVSLFVMGLREAWLILTERREP